MLSFSWSIDGDRVEDSHENTSTAGLARASAAKLCSVKLFRAREPSMKRVLGARDLECSAAMTVH